MALIESIAGIPIEKFINQIPGYFGIVDLKSKFLTLNKTGLQWIDFKTSDAVVGLPYHAMRCKAAEKSDFFIQQDELTKLDHNSLKFLGYYCYANEDWKITLGEKYLLRNNYNELVGLVCHINEITNYNLIDISRFLIKKDGKYFNNYAKQQTGYLFDDTYQAIQLSRRESECMFFLLRGKTAKSIAKILNLSPRTVEDYIEHIKSKLNCFTRTELIEKAIHGGYLNILPNSLFNSQLPSKLCY